MGETQYVAKMSVIGFHWYKKNKNDFRLKNKYFSLHLSHQSATLISAKTFSLIIFLGK